MANDENTIGLKAVLDTTDFEAGSKRIEEISVRFDKHMSDLAKRQEENAKRVADAEKQAADEQEKANKKAADAAEKAARAEETAANKRERSLRKFAIATAAVSAAVVVAYKTMSKAATELGDTEAIAQFKEMDATLGALRDTVLTVGLEILKASDAIPFLTGVMETLNQVVALAGAGLVGLGSIVNDVLSAGAKFKNYPGLRGRAEPLDTAGILARAAEASRTTLLATVNAPERRAQASIAADTEKEANKQREKTAQNIHDYNEKIRDLQIKSGESILEAEKDFHEKSAEAWQSYMEKVADITAQGIQKRAELARDYSDKIAAAETDYQRGIEDASYQHGKKLADIERDYQDTIRNIQQTYQEDALDAIRNLDAIGLVRAKEKRDKDLANARTSRDRANAAEGENYSRQLYELQRSLEDKRREAEIAYQRGLEDQKRAEQEALQEAKNAYNKQTAEIYKANADKLAAINQGYANENAAAAAQYGYSESALRAHMQAMQAIMAQYGIGGVTPPRGTPVRRRASGGLDIVNAPTQFVAGDAGPEMVYTAPLGRSIPAPITQTINHTGDFSHDINAAISSSVAGLDGRIVAVVRKAIAEVIR